MSDDELRRSMSFYRRVQTGTKSSNPDMSGAAKDVADLMQRALEHPEEDRTDIQFWDQNFRSNYKQTDIS